MQKHILWFFLFVSLLGGVGCVKNEQPAANAGNPNTPPAPTITATPTPATPVSILPTQSGITLTIWINSDLVALGEDVTSPVLGSQLAAFDADHPGIYLRVAEKASNGQGSILNYLRAGRTVAPAILPDLVLLPSSQVASAAAEQLVYPVENLLDNTLLEDLYPAARGLATVNNSLMGFPYAINGLTHLAYHQAIITGTVPATWSEMAELETGIILPAAGQESARLLLQMYLGLDGIISSESNQITLDEGTLALALALFQQGRQNGSILLRSSNVTLMSEAWLIFQRGDASMTLVTAHNFLLERAAGQDVGYAGIPGPQEALIPLVEGWVWVITSSDPTRQQVAADVINWLGSETNLGSWSVQRLTLPSRRSAFGRWPAEDGYTLFLQEQLELARPYPASATTTVRNALNDAVFNVISLTNTPAEAANTAITIINGKTNE